MNPPGLVVALLGLIAAARLPPLAAALQFALHDAQVYPDTTPESVSWAAARGLAPEHARTHSVFTAVASHLRSSTDESGSRASCLPFLMVRGKLDSQMITFGTDELEDAVAADFLSSLEGSSDAPGGWRMEPSGDARRGPSFHESRLSFSDVANSRGTVVFNSAGAHISSTLSASSLAALHGLDGAATGVCTNMYVTKADIKVSAPPHTDKQDVAVVQTQGRKRWRVFSPPNSALRPSADPFARGKVDDDLSVEELHSSGSKLLLDVTLHPGDVLFVPARFPHTTDTLDCYKSDNDEEGNAPVFGRKDWSIHLTFGLDSHVWAMNYISMRRAGLRRFGMRDVLARHDDMGTFDEDEYVGRVNHLSEGLREGLFSSLDDSLFSADDDITAEVLTGNVCRVATNLLELTERTNIECGEVSNTDTLSLAQCIEVVLQFSDTGQQILNTHTCMYTAAVEEEVARKSEGSGLRVGGAKMSTERAGRLSIFRVPTFFEHLDKCRDELRTWTDGNSGRLGAWAATQNIVNGDQVEADLGESDWLPAKVIRVRSDGLFDLQLFNGCVKDGVKRGDMKGPHGIGVFI